MSAGLPSIRGSTRNGCPRNSPRLSNLTKDFVAGELKSRRLLLNNRVNRKRAESAKSQAYG